MTPFGANSFLYVSSPIEKRSKMKMTVAFPESIPFTLKLSILNKDLLTLKALIMTAADDTHNIFFIVFQVK